LGICKREEAAKIVIDSEKFVTCVTAHGEDTERNISEKHK